MKQEIRLPEGYELKELEKGVYEIVKSEFKLEIGKDYIRRNNPNVIVIDRKGNYNNNGFYVGGGFHNEYACSYNKGWREATESEVIEAFEKELVRRFGENWKDVKVKECMYHGDDNKYLNSETFKVCITKILHGWVVWNKNGCLFYKGKWAEALEEKKVATDLNEIDRPYHIDVFGDIRKSRFDQTKNNMTSEELCEGILALQQLISFRDDFHKVHGGFYGKNHGSIRFDGNEFMVCNITPIVVGAAIFDFAEYDQAEEFYETHKDLFEELKKLY